MTGADVEVYRGADGDWYWRLKAANGQTIATSGEGYRKRSHAEEMARKVVRSEP